MFKPVFIIVAVLLTLAQANSEELGKWCESPLPGVNAYDVKITLKRDNEGNYFLIEAYADGAQKTEALKADSEIFRHTKPSTRHYRLMADGALEVFEGDELDYVLKPSPIARARSLDGLTATPSVCDG